MVNGHKKECLDFRSLSLLLSLHLILQRNVEGWLSFFNLNKRTYSRMEHKSLCYNECYSAFHLGWNQSTSIQMQTMDSGFWEWTCYVLRDYDFPPYAGLIDAHALRHATTIPLTCIWWSFIRDDTKYQTFDLSKKEKIVICTRAELEGNLRVWPDSVDLPKPCSYIMKFTKYAHVLNLTLSS